MSSMADHLRSQEYSRLRDAADSLLIEPHMSDEDAERLVEAYERNDTSAADYLAMVTSTRPFTPSASTHAVVIDSGTYCSKVAMPMVFKPFLQDHGNPVVEELLSRREVALVEKAPSGGILIHVRSSEAARKLVGQDVNLLGRKFKIKHQSPLADKFYLDIFGLRSTTTANALFMGLAELGARPLFLTPRDVNIQAQVATPTCQFYFGQEQPPACLITLGFVTNQLVYGRNFFIARGKRSLAPPQRAVGFKQSPYAVVLPTGLTQHNPESGAFVNADQGHPRRASNQAGEASVATTALVQEEDRSMATFSNLDHQNHPTQSPADHHYSGGYDPMSAAGDTEINETTEISGAQSDQDMQSATSDDDVDMTRQLESGFKRTEPSFADENPYAVLETMDYEFETFEQRTPSGTTSGVLIISHLVVADYSRDDQEPLPTKRRSKKLDKPHHPVLVPDDTVLTTTEETRLESREDRIAQNMAHLEQVQSLLTDSKNMDKIAQSMQAFPTAWSTALCTDLAAGGRNFKELAAIHLLERILASSIEENRELPFHQRVAASRLPLGKSRKTYIQFLAATLEKQTTQEKKQWEISCLLSSFKLLVVCICPFILRSTQWLNYVVGEALGVVEHKHTYIFADQMVLRLLRSLLGQQLLTALHDQVPSSEVLESILALTLLLLIYTWTLYGPF